MEEKLKYEIIHPGKTFENEFDFLETLLIENGVAEDDVEDFLHPTEKLVHDPFLMKNMDKAVEIVHKHVEEGGRILVRVDCD